MRCATTAESMTWSKCVCTGTTAASLLPPGRVSPVRSSAASILAASGAILRRPTDSSDGREKSRP